MTYLSPYSTHLPTVKECLRCKHRNECMSGEMCIIHAKSGSKITSRKEYDRLYKQRKKEQKNV